MLRKRMFMSTGSQAKYSVFSANYNGIDMYTTWAYRTTIIPDSNSPWSISAWIKTSDSSGVICGVYQYGNGSALIVQAGALVAVSGSYNITFPGINNGRWRHVAMTFQNNFSGGIDRMTLYVDGSQVASDQDYYGTNPPNIGFTIGRQAGAAQDYFSGNIDSVSYWTKELSFAEIQEIYNDGKPNNLTLHSASAFLELFSRQGDHPSDTQINMYDLAGGVLGSNFNFDANTIEKDSP